MCFALSAAAKQIAIIKLVEQGKLKLGDRIFGQGGILGTTYGKTPSI
ncbi:hypothetical protein [Nodularia sp. UHCC 0506]|nr:hypothetical protein [Nodularia sp. UHCC 0506]MEA5517140.1 hypothetical protein [Nodularia sp. UHCC 0506]